MTHRPLLVLLALALVVPGAAAAKKKNKKKKGQEEEVAAPAPKKVATKLPGDANSKAFGEALMAATISEFAPPDTGVEFFYETFDFAPGNTWTAKAYLDVAGDRFDCVESGTWSIDAADSKTVGPVNWTVTETNCPGRENGVETRAQMTILEDGDVSYEFR